MHVTNMFTQFILVFYVFIPKIDPTLHFNCLQQHPSMQFETLRNRIRHHTPALWKQQDGAFTILFRLYVLLFPAAFNVQNVKLLRCWEMKKEAMKCKCSAGELNTASYFLYWIACQQDLFLPHLFFQPSSVSDKHICAPPPPPSGLFATH